MLPEKTSYKPFLIAWNLTRQCNLSCGHCYIDAGELMSAVQIPLNPPFPKGEIKSPPPPFNKGGRGGFEEERGVSPELSREEGFRLIDDIAAVNPDTLLVLTGGEPLLYHYTLDYAGYASKKGLMVVVGTNGLLLDDAMVKRLIYAGVSGVGISLDSLDPSKHDAFRGYPGAWKRAVAAIERCRRQGLQFQIHNSVMSFNWMDVPRMVEFAHSLGARVANFFFMVCTGRGEKLTDITPQQYEEVLSTLIDLQAKYPGMLIRARCAPHFKRIAYQKDPHSPVTKAEGYLGGGCLAGSHYCRIAPDGEITPCPYMSLSVGNVRSDRFSKIWEDAPVFRDLRASQLKGKCGECEFQELCGGCRARPYASNGDYLDEDLWCQYVPMGGKKIGVARMHDEKDIKWTDEAEERLQRLPFFLRGMIKGNVEKYAKEHGISSVTPELLDELKKRRFGDKAPDMPFLTESGTEMQNQEILHSRQIAVGRSRKNEESANSLPWTKEAIRRLDAIPEFMRGIFREAAEELARDNGHMEVNVEVWGRLEEAAGSGTETETQNQEILHSRQAAGVVEWTEDALKALEERYADKPGFAREFMVGIIKEDIEREARSRGIVRIDKRVLKEMEDQGRQEVEWSAKAWQRLQKSPDFIRSGIKKAAERRAARTGVSLITSELLTQFRNMAMMKAVKRIKAIGFTELSFDAFDYARENFKNIRENKEAQERLDEIRGYVTSKGEIGLIDEEMLRNMKGYLKR